MQYEKLSHKHHKHRHFYEEGWFWLVFAIGGCCLLAAAVALAAAGLATSVHADNDLHKCLKCPKNDTGCSDGNPCTQDVLINGGCQHYDSPNNAACDTNCLVADTGVCSGGACTGTCLGNCVSSGDCPSIDGYVSTSNATCPDGGCMYTLSYLLPTAFNATCTTDSAALKEICKIGLSTTYVDCLQVDIGCDTAGYFTCIFSFACTQWSFLLDNGNRVF